MTRGRPKGYSPYIEIRYEELADWVGRKTKIPVSKKWLESLIDDGSDMSCFDHIRSNLSSTEPPKQEQEDSSQEDSKIEYTVTQL